MKKNTWAFVLVLALAIPYFWIKFRLGRDTGDLFTPININLDPDGTIMQRYYLDFQIDSLLLKNNCDAAERKIDSVLTANPKDMVMVDFKGQALVCKGNMREGLRWLNIAVQNEHFPRFLGHRAQTYSELKMYDSAIADLKECASMNYDYTKDLGFVYKKAGLPDSATRYFQIFLSHYPDSTRIQEEILKLRNGG